jgi:dipeptidyl aminopeptidase/acylaminoacyl peptidase
MIFGELDLQVPTDLNKGAMVEALKRGGNKDYTLKIFPSANHLFQNAQTGSPTEYGNLDKKFVPGFLEFMSNWILKYVDVVN